ncbi:MAG: hypothetical protein N2Z82_01150 [Thermomicrobium sp.]|nr:hypothetical protein [Thermomicrobium sp.]
MSDVLCRFLLEFSLWLRQTELEVWGCFTEVMEGHENGSPTAGSLARDPETVSDRSAKTRRERAFPQLFRHGDGIQQMEQQRMIPERLVLLAQLRPQCEQIDLRTRYGRHGPFSHERVSPKDRNTGVPTVRDRAEYDCTALQRDAGIIYQPFHQPEATNRCRCVSGAIRSLGGSRSVDAYSAALSIRMGLPTPPHAGESRSASNVNNEAWMATTALPLTLSTGESHCRSLQCTSRIVPDQDSIP